MKHFIFQVPFFILTLFLLGFVSNKVLTLLSKSTINESHCVLLRILYVISFFFYDYFQEKKNPIGFPSPHCFFFFKPCE